MVTLYMGTCTLSYDVQSGPTPHVLGHSWHSFISEGEELSLSANTVLLYHSL